MALPGGEARHLGPRLPRRPGARDDHEGRRVRSTSWRRSARTAASTCSTARPESRCSRWRRSKRTPSDVPGEQRRGHAAPAGAATAVHAAAVHRGPDHDAHARGRRGRCREKWRPAPQGRRVRSAEPAGHDPLPRHGRRRRVGRHRVRRRLRAPLRQRERDGVDREARRAQDAGRGAGRRARRSTSATARRATGPTSRQPAGVPVARAASPRGATPTRSSDHRTRRRPHAGVPAAARGRAARDRAVRRRRRRRRPCGATRPSPFDLRYTLDGDIRFTDPDGFPAVTPPWGTLTAIDMNRGGDRLAGAARGDSGLRPREARAARTTAARWSPPAGSSSSARRTTTASSAPSTPRPARCSGRRRCRPRGTRRRRSTTVDGRQFVVIAAGGGKWGAPSGGSYVAFTLP